MDRIIDRLIKEGKFTCRCEACESPDKHNIYADGYCQECYEECREGVNK
jgi:hypothetical protein